MAEDELSIEWSTIRYEFFHFQGILQGDCVYILYFLITIFEMVEMERDIGSFRSKDS